MRARGSTGWDTVPSSSSPSRLEFERKREFCVVAVSARCSVVKREEMDPLCRTDCYVLLAADEPPGDIG